MNENIFDVTQNLPPGQEGRILKESVFSCFGFSLTGASHIANQLPCQDCNSVRFVKEAGILLACIADGVGSCDLSHWGAYTAVTAALNYAETEIIKIARQAKAERTDEAMADILAGAFTRAVDAVEDLADSQRKMPFAFQSTLTLVAYDGEKVYCQHAGDDGVVAQFADGSVEMITTRIKGEEANSVVPLQSGKDNWEFITAGDDHRGAVVAMILATDGVLDAFVSIDQDYKAVDGCCNGIYYPFIMPSVKYAGRGVKDDKGVENALKFYLNKMNEKGYRNMVTDDLTMVSIVNHEGIVGAKKPDFNKKLFAEVGEKIRARKRAALYPTLSAESDQKANDVIEDEPEKTGLTAPIMADDQEDDNDYDDYDDDRDEIFYAVKERGKDMARGDFANRNRILIIAGIVAFIIIGFLLGTLFTRFFFKTNEPKDPTPENVQTEEQGQPPEIIPETKTPEQTEDPQQTQALEQKTAPQNTENPKQTEDPRQGENETENNSQGSVVRD